MILKRLSLINFKNIDSAILDFAEGINAFVGDNGAGKTNILDGIYYLSMCKSMFSLTDGQNVKHGTDFFMLDGLYSTSRERTENIVCSFTKQKSHTKTLKRNGKEYDKLSDHVGVIPVVSVSPQDSVLISQAADERRRFLNGFISQVDTNYLNSLIKYNALVTQRNQILKQGGDEVMLKIYDEQLTPHVDYIYTQRKSIIEQMTPVVECFYNKLSGEREEVQLTYQSKLDDAPYLDLMRESRQRDIVNEHTTIGVHRDDILFKIDDYPLRKFGSQGQQKSFLIALKLAQYILLSKFAEESPILLLDDLFDKLDAGRVEQLIHIVLGEEFGQIFITDCNRTRLQRILNEMSTPYRLFDVVEGLPQEHTAL